MVVNGDWHVQDAGLHFQTLGVRKGRLDFVDADVHEFVEGKLAVVVADLQGSDTGGRLVDSRNYEVTV